MTMKTTLLALAALGMMTGSALAVPVSGEQQAQFLKTCVTNGGDQQLCACKAEAAAKIVDADFMQVILASMGGRSLDPKYNVAYNDYIVESTRACGMGM
jgi:hypothetical protein